MIRTFKHKGLKYFFTYSIISKIQAKHASRLKLILAMLNTAACPDDMDAPGLHLHPLKGGRKGYYAVKVSGNWRVTFRFMSEDVCDVNYEDYH